MGFDVHGMNPQMNTPMGEIYKQYSALEWKERQEAFDKQEGLEKQYWKEQDEYELKNSGVYFRNNCWWWRPLWNFVCENCKGILSDDQMESGNYNDGVEITSQQAKEIAETIEMLDKEGVLEEYQLKYEAERIKAEEDNKGKKCSDEGYNWASSYPFNAENVRRFGEFAKQSGGFQIW